MTRWSNQFNSFSRFLHLYCFLERKNIYISTRIVLAHYWQTLVYILWFKNIWISAWSALTSGQDRLIPLMIAFTVNMHKCWAISGWNWTLDSKEQIKYLVFMLNLSIRHSFKINDSCYKRWPTYYRWSATYL